MSAPKCVHLCLHPSVESESEVEVGRVPGFVITKSLIHAAN